MEQAKNGGLERSEKKSLCLLQISEVLLVIKISKKIL
jgi:hypothetical protein